MCKLTGLLSLLLSLVLVTNLNLAYADDQGTNTNQKLPTVKLSPLLRAQPLSDAKYHITTDNLAPYLENNIIFENDEAYEEQAYIVGFAGSGTLGAIGDTAYATGIDAADNISAYTVLKPGTNFENPETGEHLGMQAKVIGSADVKAYGQPQTLTITKALEPIEVDSRLIPFTGLDLPVVIDAKRPQKLLQGFVLDVSTPTTGVVKYSVAVVSLGARDGVNQGDLFDIQGTLAQPTSIQATSEGDKQLAKIGELVVYKVMEKVSMAIILDTSQPVVINDEIMSGP